MVNVLALLPKTQAPYVSSRYTRSTASYGSKQIITIRVALFSKAKVTNFTFTLRVA